MDLIYICRHIENTVGGSAADILALSKSPSAQVQDQRSFDVPGKSHTSINLLFHHCHNYNRKISNNT